jgi:hypothetical protein
MAKELSTLEGRKWHHIMRLISHMGDRWMQYGMTVAQDRAHQRTIQLQQARLETESKIAALNSKAEILRLQQQGKISQAQMKIQIDRLGLEKDDFLYQRNRQDRLDKQNLERYNEELRFKQHEHADRKASHMLSMFNEYVAGRERLQALGATHENMMLDDFEMQIGDPVVDKITGQPVIDPNTGKVARTLKGWLRDGLHGNIGGGGSDVRTLRDLLNKHYSGDIGDLKSEEAYRVVRDLMQAASSRLAAGGKPATWSNIITEMIPGGEHFTKEAANLESYISAKENWAKFAVDPADNLGLTTNAMNVLTRGTLAMESNIQRARGHLLSLSDDPNRGTVAWDSKFQTLITEPMLSSSNNFQDTMSKMIRDLEKSGIGENDDALRDSDLPDSQSGDYVNPVLAIREELKGKTLTKRAAQRIENIEERLRSNLRSKTSEKNEAVRKEVVARAAKAMRQVVNRGELPDMTDYRDRWNQLIREEQARIIEGGRDGGLGDIQRPRVEQLINMAGAIPGGVLSTDIADLRAMSEGMLMARDWESVLTARYYTRQKAQKKANELRDIIGPKGAPF